MKSNWSDSQGWSRHSSRKHYARTGPWCKQEFRTLMQMGVTENIRLIACWVIRDGVALIRSNSWKPTPTSWAQQCLNPKGDMGTCGWAPQLGLGASEPVWAGRQSDIKRGNSPCTGQHAEGLISPQQVTNTDICESHCTVNNKHPNVGHPERRPGQPSPAPPAPAAALQAQSFYCSDYWPSPAAL